MLAPFSAFDQLQCPTDFAAAHDQSGWDAALPEPSIRMGAQSAATQPKISWSAGSAAASIIGMHPHADDHIHADDHT